MRLEDIAAEAHQLRALIDERARAAIHLARGGAANLESRFLENPERSRENPLDLLGGENLERRPAIGEPRDGRQRRTGRASRPRALAPPRCRRYLAQLLSA
jgi:hypothetical protein